MDATATEKELWSYCNSNEYISPEKIADFEQRLAQEGNVRSLNYALGKFVPYACPNCKAEGAFKWHFLGKLTHPACNATWYVSPGTYIPRQIKAAFRTGGELAGEASAKETSTGAGIGMMIFGFIMGFSFRLPFSIAMMPVQAVVSLTQKKG